MSLYHDVMEALTPLIEAFERLGIAYYIGGSASSSLHGMARRTQDIDVIADIGPGQVRSLVQALQSDDYVDEQAWQDAVRRGFPYNVLHLNTMLKIDLSQFSCAFTASKQYWLLCWHLQKLYAEFLPLNLEKPVSLLNMVWIVLGVPVLLLFGWQ